MEYTNGAENIQQGEAYFTLNVGCISKRTCRNYILWHELKLYNRKNNLHLVDKW